MISVRRCSCVSVVLQVCFCVVSVQSVAVLMLYTVGGECSGQCEVLGGRRRCWGAAADMCQTCQFSHTYCYLTNNIIPVQLTSLRCI